MNGGSLPRLQLFHLIRALIGLVLTAQEPPSCVMRLSANEYLRDLV